MSYIGGIVVGCTICSVKKKEVLQFAANEKAVVLVGNGGKAYAWGDQAAGGQIPESVANEFITKIVANSVGFAALKATGGVISWGQFEQRYIPKRVTNPKKVKPFRFVQRSKNNNNNNNNVSASCLKG